MSRIVGWGRIAVGLLVTGALAVLGFVAVSLLIPWRILRIKLCNHFGTILGSSLMRITGCPLTITGRQQHASSERPAIYASNHTSILDVFLAIWLSPTGTVGVAKKEVVWYPFFGQVYLLSGHLRIDRGDSPRARAAVNRLGEFVRRNRLSIYIWPEGTRSRDGRLLRFKKGIVHLAVQTGLPIVPMVVSGAHRAWEKSTLSVRQVPIRVDFLPAIDTSSWSLSTIDEHLAELREAFQDALPTDQWPLELGEAPA